MLQVRYKSYDRYVYQVSVAAFVILLHVGLSLAHSNYSTTIVLFTSAAILSVYLSLGLPLFL